MSCKKQHVGTKLIAHNKYWCECESGLKDSCSIEAGKFTLDFTVTKQTQKDMVEKASDTIECHTA
jgi:hypothetical protein